MNSQELIHLHALLLEVRASLGRERTIPGAFDAYDEQPVRPAHIHRRKEAHKRAIDLLLDDLVRVVQIHPPPDQTILS